MGEKLGSTTGAGHTGSSKSKGDESRYELMCCTRARQVNGKKREPINIITGMSQTRAAVHVLTILEEWNVDGTGQASRQ